MAEPTKYDPDWLALISAIHLQRMQVQAVEYQFAQAQFSPKSLAAASLLVKELQQLSTATGLAINVAKKLHAALDDKTPF
jgi:hypothetical protein